MQCVMCSLYSNIFEANYEVVKRLPSSKYEIGC